MSDVGELLLLLVVVNDVVRAQGAGAAVVVADASWWSIFATSGCSIVAFCLLVVVVVVTLSIAGEFAACCSGHQFQAIGARRNYYSTLILRSRGNNNGLAFVKTAFVISAAAKSRLKSSLPQNSDCLLSL